MLKFEWDNNKNNANKTKHGISFEEAINIFENNILIIEDIRFDYKERRFICYGSIDNEIVLTIVYTKRNKSIRIISARKANIKESRTYYEYIKTKIKRNKKH